MIFHWLWQAFKWLLRLVVPPPKKGADQTIDWKRPCPACGCIGTVSVEHVIATTKPGKVDAIRKGLMRFGCSHCKAAWFTEPLYVKQAGGRPVGPDEIHGREIQALPRV
jgi:hypothetical protein